MIHLVLRLITWLMKEIMPQDIPLWRKKFHGSLFQHALIMIHLNSVKHGVIRYCPEFLSRVQAKNSPSSKVIDRLL